LSQIAQQVELWERYEERRADPSRVWAVRPRELWLWLGGAFLTLGTVLSGIALAYFTKEPHFALYTSWQMEGAGASFVAAFACFLGAIMGWRIRLRRQQFPKIRVDVDGSGTMATTYEPMPGLVIPVRLMPFKVHFVSEETERSMSIKVARLFARVKPGGPSPLWEHLFVAPRWTISPSLELRPLRFPVNLEPQASEGGDLVFEMWSPNLADLADPFDARIEIEDANTGKRASFPATLGTFRRGHGLRLSTRAESVTGPTGKAAGPSQSGGLMGPPDP
jgi:hypothetical protein